MAIKPSVSDHTTLDNGDERMVITVVDKTGLTKVTGRGVKLLPRLRAIVKGRALAEAGIIERRNWLEVAKGNLPPGRATGDADEVVEIVNVEDVTADGLAIFDKEKVKATVLVKNEV